MQAPRLNNLEFNNYVAFQLNKYNSREVKFEKINSLDHSLINKKAELEDENAKLQAHFSEARFSEYLVHEKNTVKEFETGPKLLMFQSSRENEPLFSSFTKNYIFNDTINMKKKSKEQKNKKYLISKSPFFQCIVK